MFLKRPFLSKLMSIKDMYWLLKTQYYYKMFYFNIGSNTKIIKPLKYSFAKDICIGNNVTINDFTWLFVPSNTIDFGPKLIVEDGVKIGHFNHISAINKVHIGKNVLTADKVHISDNSHGFTNTNIPILRQEVFSKGTVKIDDGSWIGENVSILSCNIGKNCVIGSNSVVVNDIPDFSVAVGIPAKVIRKIDD